MAFSAVSLLISPSNDALVMPINQPVYDALNKLAR